LTWITRIFTLREKTCILCGKKSKLISDTIKVCKDCLIEKPDEALPIAMEAHKKSKGKYGLPHEPPKNKNGLKCGLCANNCIIPPNSYGYCGLVKNENGKLLRLAGTHDKGLLEWYYDPIPTNCVGAWICPGCTGIGYPEYAYEAGPEYGYYNLAVFYGACSLDCLFCQNWHYRKLTANLSPLISAEELVEKVNRKVSCICFFGGDPSPQMLHALKVSEMAIEKAKEWNGIMRICWETNGLMNPKIAEKAFQLSLESGGNYKFDLKAWSEPVYKALCGASNKPVYENLKNLGKKISERKNPPPLIASTLLIPGYVDAEEVEKIAGFLADIDPEIPYSLLAFYGAYMMKDLPPTSKKHAYECLKAAKKAGLENVTIGNIHLLGDYY